MSNKLIVDKASQNTSKQILKSKMSGIPSGKGNIEMLNDEFIQKQEQWLH